MPTSEKKTQRLSLLIAALAGTGLLGVLGVAGFAIHKDFQVSASGSLMEVFKFRLDGKPSPLRRPEALPASTQIETENEAGLSNRLPQ